jgi:hypothetical protein
MKKMICFVLTAVLTLFCCSCGFFGPQRYLCEVEEVESVQIIRLDKYVEGEYRYEYTVLAQVEDVESFVGQLNDIKHSVNWGEPSQMDEGYVVVRVDYSNGDFDLIYPNAQCFHKNGTNNYGYFFFNDEQFDALISCYVSE